MGGEIHSNSLRRLRRYLHGVLASGLSLASFSASAITIDVIADKSVVAPGESVMHRIVVANNDSVTRTGVVVTSNMPTGATMADNAALPAVENCSHTCDPGETPTWNLGDIPAGASKTILAQIAVGAATADTTALNFNAVVGHDGSASADTDSASITVDASPDVDLHISASQQTVSAGDVVEFDLAFGNVSGAGYVSTELRATVPAGLTFVSATDGGVLDGNDVVWDTGVVNSGEAGKRGFKAQLVSGANDAEVYQVSSTFSGDGTQQNEASELVTVYSSAGLNLDLAVNGDTSQPGAFVDYRIVVSNTDAVSKADVQLVLKVDSHLRFADGASFPTFDSGCSHTCGDSAEDYAIYELGDLAAGESRVVDVQMARSSVTAGELLTTRAMVSDANGAFTVGRVSSVLADDESTLNLVVSASEQLLAASETFEYELAFGNIDTSSYQNLVMELDLPEGVGFVSATDGATFSDGTVSWNLGTLNAGSAGKRYVVVQAPAAEVDGSILSSRARLHTGAAALLRASESVVMRSETGIHLDLAATGDMSQPGAYVDYRYVISNTDAVSKTDVQLVIKPDNHLRFADGASFPTFSSGCSHTCGDSTEDHAVYELGELSAGEIKVVNIQLARSSVVAGEVLATRAVVRDGTNTFTEGKVSTILADDENSLNLTVSASDQLVASSETFEYELAFGNIDTSSYQNLVMELDLPEGVTFISATDGGTHSNGLVSWNLGTVSANDGGKRYVVLQVPAARVDGTILSSRARLHTGGASLARASENVVVHAETGLHLDVAVSDDLSQPGAYTDYRFTVSNTAGVSKTDVQLVLKVDGHLRFADGATSPSFDSGCSHTCGDSVEDYAVYELGELGSGESKVIKVQVARSSVTAGEVLATRAIVRDGTQSFALGKTSTVLADDESTLNLLVSASDQVVSAAETFQYELAFGNIDTSSYQNLVMELDLPDGMSFVSATDGGTFANGRVSWDLATLATGAGSKRFVTVQAPAGLDDGTVLSSRARLHTGGAALIRASENVAIHADTGLSLDVVSSGVNPGDWNNVQYVVANTGATAKTDVVLRVKTDGDIRFADGSSQPSATGCSTTCGDSSEDLATYSLGTLLPGETRVVLLETFFDGFTAGEVYAIRARLTDGAEEYAHGNTLTLVATENDPGVSITSERFVVAPDANQSFEITAGWPMDTAMSNALMIVDVPAGYSFVSATGTYAVTGNQVVWPLGDMSPTSWLSETLILKTEAGLIDATVIPVSASIKDDSNLALLKHASIASVVDSSAHLNLAWSRTVDGVLDADAQIATELVATNFGGTQVADVALNLSEAFDFEFRASNAVPAATGCSTDCGDSIEDWAFWDLGNIDMGANASVNFNSVSRTNASNLPDGKLQIAHAVLRHSSSNRHDIALHKTIGVGAEFSVNPVHDSDEDGMPDVWELQYGLDRLVDDADGDLDNDGSTNLQEYLGGSDPTDENSLPACSVSASATGSAVVRETLVGNLDASASSISVGDSLGFSWTQLSGPTAVIADATAAVTTFTAPSLSSDADAVFQVTVSSACAADETAMVTVSLLNNQLPNAAAGPDQSNIEIGDTVTLNGSNSSDPEGDELSYAWVEQSSFAVTLSDANVASPTFIAPNPGTGGGALTFELTVTDALGDRDTDTVIVNVDSCPPTADAGSNVNVLVDEVFNLDASNSSDSCNGGGIASYAWVQVNGEDTPLSDDAASAPMATAPSTTGTLTYELTVTDTDGFSDTDTVLVNVSDIPLPELACRAGADQSVDEGANVILNGASSTISDNSLTITYMWELSASTGNSMLTLSTPNAVSSSFTAPEVGAGLTEAHTFTLTCSVDTGTSIITDTDTVIVNVGDVAMNTAPLANAGADDDVFEGETVMLDGTTSSDADGDSLSYMWSQDSGPSVTLSSTADAMPSFTAPSVGASGASLVFELTVSDGMGGMDTDTVTINVLNENNAPSADAGSAISVDEGDTISLDASASTDVDGDSLSFSWSQISGPAVTISAANTASASVTAPTVDADTQLVFEVVVSDGSLTATATVTVDVANVPDSTGGNNGGSGSSDEGSSGGGSVDIYGLIGLTLFSLISMRRRRLK